VANVTASFVFPLGSPPPERPKLWLAPAWVTHPLAARRCQVRNPLNGATAELSADQHAMLVACEGCRTLEEHRSLVFQKLGVRTEDQATVWSWLQTFASDGLLVSLDNLVQRFGSPGEAEPAVVAGIFVRTCDRPALLRRLLASAARLQARFRCDYRYEILDDSREPSNRGANRTTVQECGLDCTYHDLHASRLADDLRRQFPAADGEIAWLLGRPADTEATYGRPVNFALLLSAGRRLLMVDDDALLEPRRPPASERGFAVSSDPDELFCFPDWAALETACPPYDIDPIAAHCSSLGATVGSTWSKLRSDSGAADVVHLRNEDGQRFAATASILLTQNHSIGDPGSALFPYHVLTLPRLSREHLQRRAGSKGYAFRDRLNWRGQSRTRLSPNRVLTFTTLAGLDNSRLLPPAARAHRNEDLLLGEFVRHVHPTGWFLDLPWGLPHLRSPPKAWIDRNERFPQEPLHFLMDFVGQRAGGLVGERADDRMRGLAAILLDLAAAPESVLTDLLEDQAADTASRVRFAINEQLDDASVSPEWKDLLKPWMDSPALSMQPEVLRRRVAPTGVVRQTAASYGRALDLWPALWSHCRALPGR
jgi:hypothetical protein